MDHTSRQPHDRIAPRIEKLRQLISDFWRLVVQVSQSMTAAAGGVVSWLSLRSMKTLYFLFGLLLLFIVADGLLAGRSLQNIAYHEEKVSHTQSVLTQMALILTTVDEAETGQRGYILTGQSAYLQPYDKARTQLPDQLARLQTLFSGESDQQQHLATLRLMIGAKLSELQQTVALRQQGETGAALSIVLTGRGQQEMDAIRSQLGVMQASEEASLTARRAGVEASLDTAAVTLVVATLANFCLLVGIFLVLIRFMGEREQHLAEEQQARQKAEAAVELRDQFLSIASHELKTPVTSMLATTQILERRLTRDHLLDDRNQKAFTTVDNQITRLVRLLDTMLDVSRIDHGQLLLSYTSVDLVSLIAEIVDDVQQTTTRHCLQFESPLSTLLVEADPLRLEQVTRNLLNNAVKYSPEGGNISVRLEATTLPDRAAEQDPPQDVVSVPAAIIQVHDSGIGIPKEAQAHLFGRFYRAPNAATGHVTGLGIGLHVAKEIIQLHGGDITVDSDEGAGATFTIRLPIEQRHSGDSGPTVAVQEFTSPSVPTDR